MKLKGKIALVTGASRGIGKAIATRLAQEGALVVGTATSEAGAEKISAYLKELGNEGFGHILNVCDADSIATLAKTMTDGVGAPNVLVNNAGITQDNLLMRMKPEQWDSVIDTNLNSIYKMFKTFFRPMMKARWGRIINITSVVGITGNFGQANYAAAKAGVIGFTKSAAQEFASYGMTVNCVAPGFIDTDMTSAISEKAAEGILAKIPMGRKGQAEDIAASVAFLASDDAAYITGATINVNGGMYM